MLFKKFIEKLTSHSHHSMPSRPDSQLPLTASTSVVRVSSSAQSITSLTSQEFRANTGVEFALDDETGDENAYSQQREVVNHNQLETNRRSVLSSSRKNSACCLNGHCEEHRSHNCSSRSSFSGNLNKLENDIEELHLHHDHNTRFVFRNGNHPCKIVAKMNEMRKSKQLCDVILVAESEEINCHKSILAANSSYFMAMFSNDLVESLSNKVELKEVDAVSLKLLVDYMYCGELLITENNVQSLLITANLFDMTNVKDSCGQFIQSQIDVTNCLGISEFADYHSCRVLFKHAEAFIEQYFSEIVQKEEFLDMNVEQLIRLISKDHLAVHSEKIVYDCVIKWINHDQEKRIPHLARLMKHVRFCQLKQEDLVSISEDPLIKSNLACMEFILEGFQYRMMKSNPQELKLKANSSNLARVKPRVPLGLPKIMYIFGGQAPKAISKVDVYDFRSQEWLEHKDMPIKRCRAGCVYYDGLIYLVGGFNGQSRCRSTDIYNPRSQTWSSGPDLLCRRGTLGVGILNDKIYAIGGFDGSSGLVSVECWSMKLNEGWTMVAPLSTRRSSVGIAVINNYLYAIGGYCGQNRSCLDSVERYDPFSDTWSTVAHMTTRRSGACVNVYDGKIYVVGGHDGPVVLKSVEMYDPICNRWSIIADLNVARRNAGFVIHNGLFYIIGGDDGQVNLSSVEIYNPQRNVWSLLPSFLNEAKSYCSCLIIENCG